MKYYLVTVDVNYVAPVPVGWYGKIDRKSRREKKAYQMEKHLMFQTEEHMQMIFTDIVTFPCLMVSKMVHDTIRLYDSYIKFTRIILYNKARKRSMAYYMPFLKEMEVVQTNGQKGGVISLERGKLVEEVIAEVVYKGKTRIVMRMDLVESILRRGATGIGLQEIQII